MAKKKNDIDNDLIGDNLADLELPNQVAIKLKGEKRRNGNKYYYDDKWVDDHLHLIEEAYSKGYGKNKICKEAGGMSRDTFHRIMKRSKKWREEVERCEVLKVHYWEKIYMANIMGKLESPPALLIFGLKNLCNWKDKQEITQTKEKQVFKADDEEW